MVQDVSPRCGAWKYGFFTASLASKTMRLSLLTDADWESKVDHAVRLVSLHDGLKNREYGGGLLSLVIVLNCRDPELGHKQRVRHVKATSTLYIDVMLERKFFVASTHVERRLEVFRQVTSQVGKALTKRKLPDFNFSQFLTDFRSVLDEQLNGLHSNSFDSNSLERANAG